MIFPYPYFRFPLTRNYYRYNYDTKNLNYPIEPVNHSSSYNDNKSKTQEKEESSCVIENSSTENRSSDEQFFEIFGIKLYFDDILLICLIFFLYTEGIEDQSLFFALILLLLS